MIVLLPGKETQKLDLTRLFFVHVLRCFNPFCRQLALFHRFEWLQETVEHILVTDGQLEAAREEAHEEPQEDDEMDNEA